MEAYETPTFEVLGSVHELTLASTDGDFTDQDFPTNTARGDLTFS